MFQHSFRKRRVLVTGHTGFKGAWLVQWLLSLGAEVTGLALAPETNPNLFTLLGLERKISHREVDVRDAAGLLGVVMEARPEVVFHLAAQALVHRSYQEPKATWDVNVGGTINILEALRLVGGTRACVVVTSDKCYENLEQVWGYRECDPMGGHDPYSSSKGATELAVASWRSSFFGPGAELQVATARAGNVIGGGDWSADRIVVDFVRSIINGRPLLLRNPSATRPWQHVLEPLSGYLSLAHHLLLPEGHRWAEGWNFGPVEDSVVTVENLAHALVNAWGEGEINIETQSSHPHEANLLKLDCSKARDLLRWHGAWGFQDTVRNTTHWYRGVHNGVDPESLTLDQISAYHQAARDAGLPWAF